MVQLKLKFKSYEYSNQRNCWVIELDKKIEKDREEFSRIFIDISLIREWNLQKVKPGEEINIGFFDRDFEYSPFRYYDINSGELSDLEIIVRKKIEREWSSKFENLFHNLKEIEKTYGKISENLANKETIRELTSKIDNLMGPKELGKYYWKWFHEVNDNLASEMDLVWFNREILIPIRKFLENLATKKKDIVKTLRGLETDYQSMLPNAETHNEELKELPNRIKEIEELLNFFLADETNSPEEVNEINRLLGRFQKICRETEEFIQNHSPTPPVTSPESQEKEQESPTEHSENPKDESPKDQKNHGSKPLIFLLIIVVVALLFIPIYYLFSQKKPIQNHKKKIFKHGIS